MNVLVQRLNLFSTRVGGLLLLLGAASAHSASAQDPLSVSSGREAAVVEFVRYAGHYEFTCSVSQEHGAAHIYEFRVVQVVPVVSEAKQYQHVQRGAGCCPRRSLLPYGPE